MTDYFYKTTASAVLTAIIAWEDKKTAFHTQRTKLAQVFGGESNDA